MHKLITNALILFWGIAGGMNIMKILNGESVSNISYICTWVALIITLIAYNMDVPTKGEK